MFYPPPLGKNAKNFLLFFDYMTETIKMKFFILEQWKFYRRSYFLFPYELMLMIRIDLV